MRVPHWGVRMIRTIRICNHCVFERHNLCLGCGCSCNDKYTRPWVAVIAILVLCWLAISANAAPVDWRTSLRTHDPVSLIFCGLFLGLALAAACSLVITEGKQQKMIVIIAIAALILGATSALAQRRPGQRVPPTPTPVLQPAETHTVDAPEWHYADGSSKYTNLKSKLRCTSRDGREFFTTDRDEKMAFVFVTPIGTSFVECSDPTTITEDTVRIGIPYGHVSPLPVDPKTFAALNPARDVVVSNGTSWKIILGVDAQKAAGEGYTRELWPMDVFIPPPAPAIPPARRRATLPPADPINIPALVGMELHAMPAPVILNYMATNFPGVYIVISDGKVWFIRERQGLPVFAPFRQVFP